MISFGSLNPILHSSDEFYKTEVFQLNKSIVLQSDLQLSLWEWNLFIIYVNNYFPNSPEICEKCNDFLLIIVTDKWITRNICFSNHCENRNKRRLYWLSFEVIRHSRPKWQRMPEKNDCRAIRVVSFNRFVCFCKKSVQLKRLSKDVWVCDHRQRNIGCESVSKRHSSESVFVWVLSSQSVVRYDRWLHKLLLSTNTRNVF